MTPLPAGLGGLGVVACRLDQARHAATWDSGEGAYLVGGRWNSRGRRAVYCALDPSTALMEVAVHKTFRVLDTVPHVLTSLDIVDLSDVYVVKPDAVPNPNWLRPGIPSAGQQAFGDRLLANHMFVVIPSAVCGFSWNMVFTSTVTRKGYAQRSQEGFALDTQLHPPAP